MGRYLISCYFYMQVAAQFVESMLEVHGHFTEVIQGVFSSDQQFVGALDKVCRIYTRYLKR